MLFRSRVLDFGMALRVSRNADASDAVSFEQARFEDLKRAVQLAERHGDVAGHRENLTHAGFSDEALRKAYPELMWLLDAPDTLIPMAERPECFETFVVGGAFPVIGTCLSEKAAYVWLAAEMCDPSLPQEEWTQYDLIPIGKRSFVVGHNVSYDRVRARDGYTLAESEPEN